MRMRLGLYEKENEIRNIIMMVNQEVGAQGRLMGFLEIAETSETWLAQKYRLIVKMHNVMIETMLMTMHAFMYRRFI